MITFDSEFEKLGNLFLAAVRAQSGITSVTGPDGQIALPVFSADMTDLENPLSIDEGMVALQQVRQLAPETVRTLETQFRQLINEAEAGQGIDHGEIQGYVTTGSALLSSVFTGVTALVNANNTSTTNTNSTNTTLNNSSNVSSTTTSTSSSTNMTFAIGGIAILGILALAYFKSK